MQTLLVVGVFIWHNFITFTHGQTPAGVTPGTNNTLVVAWGNTVLNYTGQSLPVSTVNGPQFPRLGLPGTATCNTSVTYLLVYIDPDATQGNASTQVGLQGIQGNYTCSTTRQTLGGNTTYYPLNAASPPLAAYIPAEPQPATPAVTHRFVFALFIQPTNYTVAQRFEYALPRYDTFVYNRLNFSYLDFAQSLGQSPVAANYFLSTGPVGQNVSQSVPSTVSTPSGAVRSSTISSSVAATSSASITTSSSASSASTAAASSTSRAAGQPGATVQSVGNMLTGFLLSALFFL